MEPDIRYARNGDVAIAYQVVGDGGARPRLRPRLRLEPRLRSGSLPYWREFYERLARSFRLILFDKRGTGLSDRGGAGWAALETRMDDMRAVLDAVGSDRAVVFGSHEGGQMAALYAATYPEATEALVLFQFLRHGAGSDSPYWQQAQLDRLRVMGHAGARRRVARRRSARRCSAARPTVSGSRTGCGSAPAPRSATQLNKTYADSDVREVLPTIRVPTLVLVRGELAREAGSFARRPS